MHGILAAVLSMAFLAAPAVETEAAPVFEDGSSLHIDINIPALRLSVYLDGEKIRSYPVAVGLPQAYTPTGAFTVDHAEWNPWWRPPPNREWTQGRVDTPPGPNNPMGRVKLFFSPLYFIHGTPESESIGTPASQGCVRMRNEDVIELARLVHEWSDATMAESEIDGILRSWRPTRHARFREPPTLEIRYDPVVVEGDELVVYPDFYNRGRTHSEAVIQALMGAGIDPNGLDRAQVRNVLDEARSDDSVYRVEIRTLMGE